MMQSITTLPDPLARVVDDDQESTEIVLHPNRKWIYVSSAGSKVGAIVAYRVNPESGILKQIQVKFNTDGVYFCTISV